MFIQYLINQSKKPSGIVGQVIAKIWTSYFKKLSLWTIKQTTIIDNSRVLEIGYGGGSTIKNLLALNKHLEIHGIDISHYQGEINWDKLSDATIDGFPLKFVIVKSTEGSSAVDENFNDNFYQAREYGFIRGAYHFWSNKSSARAQANFFLKQVHLEEGDLPPVLDVEHKPQNRSIEDFQRDVLTWLHIVEDKYHVKPIIYTYYKFKEQYLSAPVFDDYPYWIAHYYVEKVEYKGKWKFWQHTDAGRLDGIRGYVDLNIFNGSFYELKRLTIGSERIFGE